MSKFFIPVIEGSSREGRKSRLVAEFVFKILSNHPQIETQLIGPADFNLPGDGNKPEAKDARYTEITARADAFFIVTPEYNYSFPGSLKRLLDSELENYKHKAVAVAGVSSGPWGGVRAIEALTSSLRRMGMVLLHKDVQFPFVENLVDSNGIPDPQANAQYTTRVNELVTELLFFTDLLQQSRKNS